MLSARQSSCRREFAKPLEGCPLFSLISSNRALAWLAVAIVFVTLCFRLGYLPLLEPDEERNAEVAREMKDSGSWLVPTFDGLDCLDKPAFYFKTVSLSLAAIGNNEMAARIPSAAFGVALVILVFVFCRAVHGTRCALLATIIVATTPLYLALARIVIFDMMLAFFVCGAIFSGFLAESTEDKIRQKWWYCLGAASAGFATLVKGPVGIVVPVLVLLVFNWGEGRRAAWKRLLAPVNLLVFFGITLPWFVGLCLVHRDFLRYGLVEESFHRFTSAKAFNRAEPVYFYLLIVAGTFFPWSLLLPGAGIASWKEHWPKHSADRLCLLWSVVVVLFFSISQSKMPAYILSVTVASGILVARVFDAALADSNGRPARLVGHATTAFGIICLLAGAAVLTGATRLSALAHPLRIPVADAERFGREAVPLGILLFGLGAFALFAHYRRNASLGFLCLSLLAPLGIIVNANMIEKVVDAKSARRIANQLAAMPPRSELACFECFPTGLPFYLQRTVTLISRNGRELTSNYIVYSLQNGPRQPEQIVPPESFDHWLASRTTPVSLIVHENRRDELEKIAVPRNGTIQSLSPGYLVAYLPAPKGP